MLLEEDGNSEINQGFWELQTRQLWQKIYQI